MLTHSFISLFHFDSLSLVLMALVGFLGGTIGLFASRYLQGDRLYFPFLSGLALLMVAVMLMVASDHLLVLLALWGISNVLLIKLMIHKPSWKAAQASGWLAAKTLGLGFACLTGAFALLYSITGESSIQALLHSPNLSDPRIGIASILIILAAMTQSAIWPFHRWLLSSLNSPTPVSAMMHAGIVNGGGFLLVRFSPLYTSQPTFLTVIFILGLSSAWIGTLWKLMQNDVKRMLACSTLGQMGFMFAQFGLGLFPAAIAHLCWHGLFKANLFLNSNSAAFEKRIPTSSPSLMLFLLAMLCGLLGSYVFATISDKSWLSSTTTTILNIVAWLAASQLALTLFQRFGWKKALYILPSTLIVSSIYGLSVWWIEKLLASSHIPHPQPLNIYHWIGIVTLIFAWLIMVFQDRFKKLSWLINLYPILYTKGLNASQPHPSTITSHRNDYQYK